ncbi:glutamate--cysteine ligase [Rheinheimera sp.]|uniref:glutamate--cysteine ligase n=1 Tax=Rheinheimera sp. TaxID=1869214 RepID=UPI003AF7AB60
MSHFLEQRLQQLGTDSFRAAITGIRRGLERETLRILPDGRLAQSDHAQALGSALSHPLITTDFSESLLEFITPAQSSIEVTLQQLADIHKFSVSHIGEEQLWPGSMPCFIRDQDEIRLAQYGSSNVGRMKTLYREGLKNRYGSMMQAISGVHFNFSIPTEFWQQYQQQLGNSDELQDFISTQYLHLIRNYKRYVWLIVYLFGASPVMCKSFLQGREPKYQFQSLGKGSIYLPYATSLRMSDLGYTNNAQSSLNISYNSLPDYIQGLRQAISTPSPQYQQIGVKVDGQYRQLNGNILQIENEFYSTIRPKRTTQSGERPTCALKRRGVEYIEVRSLDVNPFSPVGISAEQMRFLDLFLLYCLFEQSPLMTAEQQALTEQNLRKVVAEGRRQNLELLDAEQPRLMLDWAEQIFADMMPIARWMDEAHGADLYQATLKDLYLALLDPAKTLSGRWLNTILSQQRDHGCYALELSANYKQQFASQPYGFYQQTQFEQMAAESLRQQQQVEQADSLSFDQYLHDYFVDL